MLTGKQKRYLRSLAVKQKALVQIGKDGLDENVIESTRELLKARELVKIRILKTCETDIHEILIDLLASTNAEHVQTIGRNIVLYRQSRERMIDLP